MISSGSFSSTFGRELTSSAAGKMGISFGLEVSDMMLKRSNLEFFFNPKQIETASKRIRLVQVNSIFLIFYLLRLLYNRNHKKSNTCKINSWNNNSFAVGYICWRYVQLFWRWQRQSNRRWRKRALCRWLIYIDKS